MTGKAQTIPTTNDFPSLSTTNPAQQHRPQQTTAPTQKHTLRAEAPSWSPPAQVTQVNEEKINIHTNLESSFSEKEMGSGIRLGGGVFGPSRVEGRITITKKTRFQPNYIVAYMMEKMGWIEGFGLGVHLQGILDPIDTEPKYVRCNVMVEGGRAGIGFC